jgi:hypothetical protein
MIVLRKYSVLNAKKPLLQDYVEVLAREAGTTVCVADRRRVIVAAGGGAKNFVGMNLAISVYDYLQFGVVIQSSRAAFGFKPVFSTDSEDQYDSYLLVSVISASYVIGAVLILVHNRPIGNTDVILAKTAALFLGKVFE